MICDKFHKYDFKTARVLGFLAFYFSLHIILRVVSSPALELDEGEQVVLSQWLLPFYLEQPPLYTWLQIAIINIFGINVFSLSVLKNTLLFLSYLFILLSVKKITNNNCKAILASVSLIFIPQISWSVQRDLTHSVLLLSVLSAFFYIIVSLIKRKNLIGYTFLGITMGLGLLSKHNFILFSGALILACLTSHETRNFLIDKRIFLAIFITLLIISPYILSIVSDSDYFISVMNGPKTDNLTTSIKVLSELIYRIPIILLPLCIVYAIVFRKEFFTRFPETCSIRFINLIQRYIIFLILLLSLSIFLLEITTIKNRWIAPLIVLIPLYLIIRSREKTLTPKKISLFLRITAITGILILVSMCIRNLSCSISGLVTDFNYPSETIAGEIRELGFQKGIIIADNRRAAGALKIQFKDSIVLCPEIRRLKIKPLVYNSCKIVVLWSADKHHLMPTKLREYLVYDLGISRFSSSPIYKDVPLHLCENKTIRVGIFLI